LFVVGARQSKKAHRTGATASVALHRSNFTPDLARCGPDFDVKGKGVSAFKGGGGQSFRSYISSDIFSYTNFSCENVPLKVLYNEN
jgi:hypothetical protein